MPLIIEDQATTDLVEQLAEATGLSETEAVRAAVTVVLDPASPEIPLHQKFAALRALYPLPPPTGLKADKAFYDELSGE